MTTPQSGIFALGTSSHAYLEFDLLAGGTAIDLVCRIAALREPRTTMGGINLVSGFRPELWRSLDATQIPEDVVGFDEPILGSDGFIMPATQHDAVLWLSGSGYDVVFDEARAAMEALRGIAAVRDETSGWAYRHDRDLTGFIDGTENPSLLDAPRYAVIPEGGPGAGGTVLLLQKWAHEVARWEALADSAQERVIGRTKPDSVELDPQVADSHVALTDQARFGHIFRRNTPYGTVTEHGTMFVGFSAEQSRLIAMLASMAGANGGTRDALTRYTRPLSGAYYFIPSAEAIRGYAPPDADG
ncbi:MAG TPA: Dyp-type peroxidase [Candidatus Binatia bacterium]|nr:Dyp-type peroxidase [Candidatus Binatia bacterium]